MYFIFSQLQDKIVLDVECGTGILLMFVANSGAARVIDVESFNIVEYAKQIVITK